MLTTIRVANIPTGATTTIVDRIQRLTKETMCSRSSHTVSRQRCPCGCELATASECCVGGSKLIWRCRCQGPRLMFGCQRGSWARLRGGGPGGCATRSDSYPRVRSDPVSSPTSTASPTADSVSIPRSGATARPLARTARRAPAGRSGSRASGGASRAHRSRPRNRPVSPARRCCPRSIFANHERWRFPSGCLDLPRFGRQLGCAVTSKYIICASECL